MTVANPATASTPASGSNVFTYAQLEGIWTQAGGTNGAAPIAAAIAMAESGGNSTATHADSNGTVDRGLWQINSVHGSQSSYDVMTNARAAVAISNNGQNWTPWTTFNNGAYRRYLQIGVPPDSSAPINATNAAANQGSIPASLSDSIIPGIPAWADPIQWYLNPLGTISGAAGSAASAVGGTLIRAALRGLILTMLNPLIQIMAGILGITAGGTMVIISFWVVARQTQTGQTAERGAMTAAQTGASFIAPETKAATVYKGAAGQTAIVTSTRRQAGQIRAGGRTFTYRQPQVRTEVQRQPAPPPPTKEDLRNRSYDFTKNGNGR